MKNSAIVPDLHHIFSDPDLFSPMDRHFAMFIGRLSLEHKREASIAAALASREIGNGSICLNLAEFAGKQLGPESPGDSDDAYVCPSLPDWGEKLLASGVASRGEKDTPLVLGAGNRVYLRRYWNYENTIVGFIRQRAGSTPVEIDYSGLAQDMARLFQPLPADDIDWQQVAAIAAVTNTFCVISGGPGTGKTSTVVKILALLSGQCKNSHQLRILLGAPTGKAASRLQQAIALSGLLPTGSEPPQATTLHRMLGSIPDSPYFRHNADNPLVADIIVIDEASMVDLPLMAKLMQAVPVSARLILLGDRHQLASVQPGSVFGDICHEGILSCFSTPFRRRIVDLTGTRISPAPCSRPVGESAVMEDSFVELEHNYRFAPDSALARLSMAVKQGDGAGALEVLQQSDDDSLSWMDVPVPSELDKTLKLSSDIALLSAMQQMRSPDSCFKLLDSFCILCALRKGPFGMENVNAVLEQQLMQGIGSGSEKPSADTMVHEKSHLLVRPVMVTRNDYNLQLFNGDIGIVLPAPEKQGTCRAFFRDHSGKLRDSNPSLLPSHESVFAMTVHKSQGSEFNRILLILPDQDTELLTRELLYTAVTRAREKVTIWGRKELFTAAVKRQIRRTSGLAQALWE